ncbi:MAG: hypothetical protein WKF70_07800 [Chitinophagaceae bacterium]
MIKLFFVLLLASPVVRAHPGVGIVKDTRGNVYYTDLQQVWKISNGTRKVVVPNVHSHELYISPNDDLYGENETYDDKANKFFHYLWVYHPNGQLDTLVGKKEAYIDQDFSLSRDDAGNEYYIKQFLVRPDTTHIFLKSGNGAESILASGKFKGITWLHPQAGGSLLYALNNAIYRVDTRGNVHLVKDSIGNTVSSFGFSRKSITIWGIWEDKEQNIYVAVFSDQTVKRIDKQGRLSNYYRSKGNWAPLHGVFDNDNKLWLMEGSDQNEVRVALANSHSSLPMASNKSYRNIYMVASVLALGIVLYYFRFKWSNQNNSGKLV